MLTLPVTHQGLKLRAVNCLFERRYNSNLLFVMLYAPILRNIPQRLSETQLSCKHHVSDTVRGSMSIAEVQKALTHFEPNIKFYDTDCSKSVLSFSD